MTNGEHPMDTMQSLWPKSDDDSGARGIDPRTESTFSALRRGITTILTGVQTGLSTNGTGYVWRIDESVANGHTDAHYSSGRQYIARVCMVTQKDISWLATRPGTYDETAEDFAMITMMPGFLYGPEHNDISIGKIVDVSYYAHADNRSEVGQLGIPQGTVDKVWDHTPVLFPRLEPSMPKEMKFRRASSLSDQQQEAANLTNIYHKDLVNLELILPDMKMFDWDYPVDPAGMKISSQWSEARQSPTGGGIRPHHGVDIVGANRGDIFGSPVRSVWNGTVTYVHPHVGRPKDPAGHWIEICHGVVPAGRYKGKGVYTRYFHLKNSVSTNYKEDRAAWKSKSHPADYLVAVGDRVIPGQQIGFVGNTGDITGIHLHFELWTGDFGGPGALINRDENEQVIEGNKKFKVTRMPGKESHEAFRVYTVDSSKYKDSEPTEPLQNNPPLVAP